MVASNPYFKASTIKLWPIDTSSISAHSFKNFKLSKFKSCPALTFNLALFASSTNLLIADWIDISCFLLFSSTAFANGPV